MSEYPQEKKENRQVLTNNDEYGIEPLFDYSIRSHQTNHLFIYY